MTDLHPCVGSKKDANSLAADTFFTSIQGLVNLKERWPPGWSNLTVRLSYKEVLRKGVVSRTTLVAVRHRLESVNLQSPGSSPFSISKAHSPTSRSGMLMPFTRRLFKYVFTRVRPRIGLQHEG